MFSILQKPKDNVNAEDLETLQDELERRLVDVVTYKWNLERELETLNNLSPDSSSQPALATTASVDGNSTNNKANNSSSQPTSSLPSGKLRNSLKLSQIDSQIDNASDGFKGSLFTAQNNHRSNSSNSNNNNSGNTNNNNGASGTASGTNSNETDSISSEGSLTSNLTSSTIITANLAELSAQYQSASSISNSNKRSLKNSSNDRPSKRFRPNSSHPLQSTGPFPKRPPHSKHRSKIVPSKFRNSTEESRPNKKQILKNEAPDKLWPFVYQFCATPTEEQIKDLEEMLKAMDNDKEYYKVPAVVKKEAGSASESITKEDGTNNQSNNNKTQKKSQKIKVEEEPTLGALTQRLVSGFMEETEDNGTEMSKSSSDASSPPAKKRRSRANKSIEVGNAKNLEKQIRQQLEEYSILTQQDDIPYISEEDEVLRELLACQHELLSIQSQNRHSMQLLLKKAKRHSELEIERSKLAEANADVIAAYHRLIQAKQRKRNPTKKEKDAAWKALKTHEVIFKKCDELYMTGLDRNNA